MLLAAHYSSHLTAVEYDLNKHTNDTLFVTAPTATLKAHIPTDLFRTAFLRWRASGKCGAILNFE
jgi:hypothetical protein